MNANQSMFLSIPYLQGLAKGLSTESKFYYAFFSDAQGPVGIAVFQLTHFEMDELSSNVNEPSCFVSLLSKALVRADKRIHVLLCGNAFATGEHGFSFVDRLPVQAAMDGLCYALTEILHTEKEQGTSVSAILAKDFYQRSLPQSIGLKDCGFKSFEVDQNMVLPLLPEWKNLEDYLQALTTKFRTKAKAAFSRSASLEIAECSLEEWTANQDEYYALYENVYRKADFRLGKMTREAFVALKSSLGSRMFIRSYRKEGKLIGFSTAMLCPSAMDAHLIGLDYSCSAEYAVYSRMLYDYIELAILQRSAMVVFGRTAAEIKSTVGAIPVSMYCSIRHPKRISNYVMSCVMNYVKPGTYPIRQPWKVQPKQQLVEVLNRMGCSTDSYAQ
jgi:hypothetical protein